MEVTRTPTTRRCSLRGCRNLKASLFARSSDKSNSVWLCDKCIKEIYALTFGEPPTPEQLEELRIANEALETENATLKSMLEETPNECEPLTLECEQPITIQNAQIPDSGTIDVVNATTSTTTSKSSGKKK